MLQEHGPRRRRLSVDLQQDNLTPQHFDELQPDVARFRVGALGGGSREHERDLELSADLAQKQGLAAVFVANSHEVENVGGSLEAVEALEPSLQPA